MIKKDITRLKIFLHDRSGQLGNTPTLRFPSVPRFPTHKFCQLHNLRTSLIELESPDSLP